MTVLIIGSNGFLGSALFSYFSLQDDEVFGADIISQVMPNYFFINALSPDYDKIFKQHKFDFCINASGAADVNFSVSNPASDYELNSRNVFYMLDAIRKFSPGCRFIQISSAAVYGNPASLPVHENFPLQPLSPYGFHKWQSEILCREFTAIYGIRATIVRIFSAYGPGLRKQLFWELYKKSLESNHIELFGTGQESRDFIYIDDIARALHLVMQSNETEKIINIASGMETTVGEAVNTFFDQMNIPATVSFNNITRTGDPLNWRADIRALSGMGFRSQTSFPEGVKKYCQWLKSL